MELENFKREINKTGFVLEYQVSHILQQHGWTVINNKHYLDDIHGTVREIDILAYKAKMVEHFIVYTTLIISCKKNDENAWVMLAKEADSKNPNIDWNPLHIWTNEKILQYIIKQPDWREKYLNSKKDNGCAQLIVIPKKQLFAFQEMNKATGKPKNDKNIFESITSLMKAQDFEMNSLSKRKEQPAVYQFNLISVVDTDLIRLDISWTDIIPIIIYDEFYLVNYIVNKKQTAAKIHFINISKFDEILNVYDKLHEVNNISFPKYHDDFFDDVIKDYDKTNILIDDLRAEIFWSLRSKIRSDFNITIDKKDIRLFWSEKQNILRVELTSLDNDDQGDKLNKDSNVRSDIAKALKNIYRYEGDFKIVYDALPF